MRGTFACKCSKDQVGAFLSSTSSSECLGAPGPRCGAPRDELRGVAPGRSFGGRMKPSPDALPRGSTRRPGRLCRPPARRRGPSGASPRPRPPESALRGQVADAPHPERSRQSGSAGRSCAAWRSGATARARPEGAHATGGSGSLSLPGPSLTRARAHAGQEPPASPWDRSASSSRGRRKRDGSRAWEGGGCDQLIRPDMRLSALSQYPERVADVARGIGVRVDAGADVTQKILDIGGRFV